MKQLKSLVPALAVVLLSGCFNITEEVWYHKDGTGHYKMLFDLSSLNGLISFAEAMDKDKDGDKSMSIKSSSFNNKGGLDTLRRLLETIPGINKVNTIEDSVKLRFGIEFDYANLTALNKALNTVFAESDKSSKQKIVTNYEYFKADKNSLERLDPDSRMDSLMTSFSGGDGDMNTDLGGSMAELFLKDMYYATVYHFDVPVKAKNKLTKCSADGKTVEVRVEMLEARKSAEKLTIANKLSW